MQAKGHITQCLGGMIAEGIWPQEHWERQLPLSLPVKCAAAPVTAKCSRKHSDMFSAPTDSFLALLLPPLFTLWSKRNCWEGNSPVEMSAFQKPTFSFSCNTFMGKNKQLASKTAEALKHRMDLLQPSWALCKADPSFKAPLKEWEESQTADCGVLLHCTPGTLCYRQVMWMFALAIKGWILCEC